MEAVKCLIQPSRRLKKEENRSDYLLSLSFSVSESDEWVCTKTVFPNQTVVKGCERTYTGGKKNKEKLLNDQDHLSYHLTQQEGKHSLLASGAQAQVKGGRKKEKPISSETPLKCLCSEPLCNSASLSRISLSVILIKILL